ncbi:MAG: hypothetical protein IPK27_22430 [Rhodanobacteraceae bacterium]|nr:hypothetical protein [Rhodanobacteraceae bacterium]
MSRSLASYLLLFLLPWHCAAAESPKCASTIGELESLMGAPGLPLEWAETTMDDGKPLLMSIVQGNGALMLGFTKTGEGLWAESAGVVCRSGSTFEARFSKEQIRLGPAAGWLLSQALKSGGKFTLTRLGPEQLRISTRGWRGDFSAVVE